jgi:hypothetical protein
MDVLLQILIYGLLNGAILALKAISVTVVCNLVHTLTVLWRGRRKRES